LNSNLEGERESCRSPSSAVGASSCGNGCGRGRRVSDCITGRARRARVVRNVSAHIRREVGESRVIGPGSDGVSLNSSGKCSCVRVRCTLSRSLNRAQVGRESDGGKDAQDQDDDEEFDEGETLSVAASSNAVLHD